jgi:hypothetical protein
VLTRIVSGRVDDGASATHRRVEANCDARCERRARVPERFGCSRDFFDGHAACALRQSLRRRVASRLARYFPLRDSIDGLRATSRGDSSDGAGDAIESENSVETGAG